MEQYHQKFLQAKRHLELFEDHEIPREMLTPRFMYLREVEKMQTLPLPLVLRKESNPVALMFGHKGLGVSMVEEY